VNFYATFNLRVFANNNVKLPYFVTVLTFVSLQGSVPAYGSEVHNLYATLVSIYMPNLTKNC